MKEINSKYTLASTVPLDSIQPLDGSRQTFSTISRVYVDSLYPSGYLKDQFTSQLKLTVRAAEHTDEAYTALTSIHTATFKVKNYCGLSISDPQPAQRGYQGKRENWMVEGYTLTWYGLTTS